MHEIVPDTETTGLDPLGGDRVVEKRGMQIYLRRGLGTFCNPLVYTFLGSHGPSIMIMTTALVAR